MMGFCALALAGTMSMQVVLNQIQEWNRRNFDVLFSNYYSPQLEVYSHPDFEQVRGLIRTLNDESVAGDVKSAELEGVTAGHDKNLFPDLGVLRGHVQKQFASPLENHVDVLEKAHFGNYVVTLERKKRDGIIVDACDIYYIENGMIRKMWIAKAP